MPHNTALTEGRSRRGPRLAVAVGGRAGALIDDSLPDGARAKV